MSNIYLSDRLIRYTTPEIHTLPIKFEMALKIHVKKFEYSIFYAVKASIDIRRQWSYFVRQ